jgi:DHA2 family multidrug resistance protein-like MFS transporter
MHTVRLAPVQKNHEEGRTELPDGLPTPARYWAMAAILLGISLTVLDSTLVNLALPDITRHFGSSPASAVWVVNAYQLATLVLLLPCAKLGERVGYRRVYLVGLTVFTLASLLCVLAPSLALLAGARALQGFGAAGMMAVNAALVRLTYPSSVLARGLALNSMVVATSSVAGPSVAALVLSVASWSWLFIIQVPLGLALLWIGRRALPFNPRRSGGQPLQAVEVVLNIAMFSLVFLGADAFGARSGGVPDARMLATGGGMIALGALVAWIYVRRQWRQATPLFPVDLLRIPVFALSMCTSVTAFSAQTLAFVALPFLLLQGQGRSHFGAGLLITAWPAAVVVMAPIAGRLLGRHPAGKLGGIGQAVLSVGLLCLALLPAQPANWQMAVPLLLCGAGFGLFQSPNNHTIVTSAPLQRAGAASGMLGTARLTGQTLGAVLLALVFSAVGVQGGGPSIAFGLASAMAAASATFSFLRLRAV